VLLAGVVDDHQRLAHAAAHLGELACADQRREHHVGAGFGVELQARYAVLQVAVHPERVGARDDQEAGIGARRDRCLDTVRRVSHAPQLLRSACVLARAGVILDVDRGDPGVLEGENGFSHLEPAFGIRNHRNPHRTGDGARLLD